MGLRLQLLIPGAAVVFTSLFAQAQPRTIAFCQDHVSKIERAVQQREAEYAADLALLSDPSTKEALESQINLRLRSLIEEALDIVKEKGLAAYERERALLAANTALSPEQKRALSLHMMSIISNELFTSNGPISSTNATVGEWTVNAGTIRGRTTAVAGQVQAGIEIFVHTFPQPVGSTANSFIFLMTSINLQRGRGNANATGLLIVDAVEGHLLDRAPVNVSNWSSPRPQTNLPQVQSVIPQWIANARLNIEINNAFGDETYRACKALIP